MELDGDGNLDLLSGSYSRHDQDMAGLFQVLWGEKGGGFRGPEALQGDDGELLIVTSSGGEDDDVERICTRPFAADLDGDGKLDIIFSNEKEFGIYLFKDMKSGWSRKVLAGKRGDADALPMISRNGTNNGFWVHSGQLWWSNEDTVNLKDHVDRRSIKELLKKAPK